MTNFKHAFSRLSKPKKVVFVTSSLVALSCLLPWYHDLSVYGVGDTYLGVTGPLFLTGVFMFLLSGFTALSIGLPMMGKRFFKLPVKGSIAAMFAGLQSLFLILIANSVFYHSKFGVSINHKQPGFGMTLAILAVIGVIAGSYFWYKEEFSFKGFDEQVGKKEPLIKVRGEELGVRSEERVQRAVNEPPKNEEVYTKKQPLRGFGFREPRLGESINDLVKSHVPAGDIAKTAEQVQDSIDPQEGHGGKKENMVIRMDL